MAMISPPRPRNPMPPGELRAEFMPSDRIRVAFGVPAATDSIRGVTGLDCRSQSAFNSADLELRYRLFDQCAVRCDRWRTTAHPAFNLATRCQVYLQRTDINAKFICSRST
jgi:hypothetical protein